MLKTLMVKILRLNWPLEMSKYFQNKMLKIKKNNYNAKNDMFINVILNLFTL